MSGEAWIVTTPVSTEPVTMTETKAYLRVDFSNDDTVITNLITRARSLAETVTGRAFATQTIRHVFPIARPEGGELSGPINRGPNWYAYQQQLGANPFGAAQFYFDLAMPPVDLSVAPIIETKITAFDQWKVFPQVTNSDGSTNTYVENVEEPARVYIMSPITANFWRFTYQCGYNTSYPLPPDLKQALFEAIGIMYDNREGYSDTDAYQTIVNKLLAKRVSWV